MPHPPLPMDAVRADVVVVGGGGAGLRAALSAKRAGADVRLVVKAPPGVGGSTAHGGSELMSMGAALGHADPRDCPEVHFQDTMRAGRGFIDETLVRLLAEEAPPRARDLIDLGVPFERDGDKLRQRRSDFATYPRTIGVGGRTGKAIVDALGGAIHRLGVPVDEGLMVADLVRTREGEVCGLLAWDIRARRLVHYRAKAVVLATGGVHGAFSQQVSTAEMTGDGQALCFRHGAELVNMEFHQVGPALVHPYVQLFSGPLFRLHPHITNAGGERFLERYLPAGIPVEQVLDSKVFPFTVSNASRYLDISMASEIAEGRGTAHGAVWFRYGHVPESTLRERVPKTFGWLARHGLHMARDPLEVGIVFQCVNGGVRMCNGDAECTIPGLFVVGEVAGGLRGPDRPGGNSLAEGQVFGHRAGRAAARRAGRTGFADPDPARLAASLDRLAAPLGRSGGPPIGEARRTVQESMQRHCLVQKDGRGLTEALGTVRRLDAECREGLAATPETLGSALELEHLLCCAELLLRACRHREESRSGHYRSDFPEAGGARWLKSFIARRDADEIRLIPHDYLAQKSPAEALA